LDIQEGDTIPNHAVVRCVVEKPSPSQVKARVLEHFEHTEYGVLQACIFSHGTSTSTTVRDVHHVQVLS